MRQFDEIEHIGNKTFIYTYYNRYILDDTSLSGNYVERRLMLSVQATRDEPLYPLKKICNTVQEMVNSEQTHFITMEGRILEWRKTKFFRVISLPVIHTNIISDTQVETFYKLPEGGLERVVTGKLYKYVYAIQLGSMCYVPLDFGDKFLKPCKKKL